jgi:hypothetical protein
VSAVVLCLAALTMPAAALTEQDCRAHRDTVLDGLARNREQRVRHVEEALRKGPSQEDREYLEQEREQAWEYEERMRQLGDQTWRDCMAHVRATGDAK